jgi:hypothetical protein
MKIVLTVCAATVVFAMAAGASADLISNYQALVQNGRSWYSTTTFYGPYNTCEDRHVDADDDCDVWMVNPAGFSSTDGGEIRVIPAPGGTVTFWSWYWDVDGTPHWNGNVDTEGFVSSWPPPSYWHAKETGDWTADDLTGENFFAIKQYRSSVYEEDQYIFPGEGP